MHARMDTIRTQAAWSGLGTGFFHLQRRWGGGGEGGGSSRQQRKKLVCFVALHVLYSDMNTISFTPQQHWVCEQMQVENPAESTRLHLTPKKVNKKQQAETVAHLQHLLPVQSDEVFIQLISPSPLPPCLLMLSQKACKVDVSIFQHHVDGAFCLYDLYQ